MKQAALPVLCGSRTEPGHWPLWLAAALLFGLSLIVAPRTSTGDSPPTQVQAADLDALQRAFQDVVRQVSPSVVGIRAQRRHWAAVPAPDAGGEPEAIEQRIVINGSATIVREDGLLLTNEHVIQGASDIDVLFADGQKLRGTVLAADPRSDLAIVRVPRTGLRPVQLCDWSAVARGQWSIVVGNPFGLGLDGQLSISVGIIANLGRQLPGLGEVDDRFYSDMIQVTAPIHPGNSGGPLFNIHGELIGVVTAMHTRTPADDGVGFAIPMSPAKTRIINLLCQGRPIEYGYIGLTVRSPDPVERDLLDVGHGVIVQRIEPEGPAAVAGLQAGDVVLTFGAQPVNGPAHLAELAGQSAIGAIVPVEFLRDGRPVTVQLAVQQRDVSRVAWMRGNAVTWRGLRLVDLSDEVRRRMHVDADAHGVVVIDVDADSPAARAKLQAGEVIEAVGDTPVQDTLEFLQRVRAVKGTLILSVRNAGERLVTP